MINVNSIFCAFYAGHFLFRAFLNASIIIILKLQIFAFTISCKKEDMPLLKNYNLFYSKQKIRNF
jgi:hypothetical protein